MYSIWHRVSVTEIHVAPVTGILVKLLAQRSTYTANERAGENPIFGSHLRFPKNETVISKTEL